MKNKLILIIFPILFIASACKKIKMPDEESKAIFGQWQFSHDSGGFSGSGGSNTFGDNYWVEFNENGIYNVFKDSKRVQRHRFKIEENDGYAKYKINFSSSKAIDYSYKIEDNKLILSEQVSDGFMYVFVKK